MNFPVLLGYIDPVSGSILLQALVAGGIGVAATFRRSIQQALMNLVGLGTAKGNE